MIDNIEFIGLDFERIPWGSSGKKYIIDINITQDYESIDV
ncbi:hypothetical protein CLIT_22c00030 [Peptoclostridium litorale DSM 5388]|uniref:Uncharacterized protein n=1 Tax=Peptoclostridium litorale DSM 5388 TaxID=1121324 RepID=A0A069RC36_PEPLI|nr:hypothetical protein CLIT_22c00030 [Peptoclostridium litorale DSM 5388]